MAGEASGLVTKRGLSHSLEDGLSQTKYHHIPRITEPMVRVEEAQILCAKIHGGNHGPSAESERVSVHHRCRTSSATFFCTALERLAVTVEEYCVADPIQDNARIARHVEL